MLDCPVLFEAIVDAASSHPRAALGQLQILWRLQTSNQLSGGTHINQPPGTVLSHSWDLCKPGA